MRTKTMGLAQIARRPVMRSVEVRSATWAAGFRSAATASASNSWPCIIGSTVRTLLSGCRSLPGDLVQHVALVVAHALGDLGQCGWRCWHLLKQPDHILGELNMPNRSRFSILYV